jgi:hypothetical protein
VSVHDDGAEVVRLQVQMLLDKSRQGTQLTLDEIKSLDVLVEVAGVLSSKQASDRASAKKTAINKMRADELRRVVSGE